MVVILALGFFAFAEWTNANAPQPKKLDYSKPIVTGYSAIICPQSVLSDIRADHDANALSEAFSALTNRAQKAEALGCEVIREGIPVKASKMDDSFVSISVSGLPGSFFTMEGELENPEGAVSVRSADGGTDALATAMESGRIEFQKAFPALDKSMPNLRWFEDQIGGDSQESASLITPYGECMLLTGNSSAGYSLLFGGNYYHAPHEKGKILGSYQGRLTAIHAAEDYCHRWYLAERSKPPNVARDSHIWFTPEDEAIGPTDQAHVAVPVTAPIERRVPSTQIPQSIAQNRNGQAALTVVDRAFGNRYSYYVSIVGETVNRNWYGQEIDAKSSQGKSVTILFDINRDGTPSNIRVETPSGSPSLDLSVIHALQSVATFGPLPTGDKQTVEDTFTYHPQ